MKHHLLRLIVPLLLVMPALHAQEKKIIVSSLGTPEKAERALNELQHYLEAYPDISSLLDENGIALHTRPSGKYFIVVIEPFSNKEHLSKVKQTIQQRYPGLFVNNYTPETDLIVAESTTPSKVTIQEEVTIDMVTEEVPESLLIIKESEDAAPRVVAADTVEVPQVIALNKETLEEPVKTTTSTEATAPKTKAVIEKIVEKTAPVVSKTVNATQENASAVIEKVVEKTAPVVSKTVNATQESVNAKVQEVSKAVDTMEHNISTASKIAATIKEPVANAAHNASATAARVETSLAGVSKENFINHNPDHQTTSHHSVFPPWWVLLSVLVLILSPIGSYIDNRNNKFHR